MTSQPHFVLFPLMAPGHMIPMVDIAKLLARRGATVTVVTTPINSRRFTSARSGQRIRFLELRFPSSESGLPEGCENLDLLPSLSMASNFFIAISKLRDEAEQRIEELDPKPSCMISDMGLPWTAQIAGKIKIPRIVFHGTCCFSLLCSHNILTSNVLHTINSETEHFVVPGLPEPIELSKCQLPGSMNANSSSSLVLTDVRDQIRLAEKSVYGVVVNSFEELEHEYVELYRKAKSNRVWCVGPVSLCNTEISDKADRGNKASINEDDCLEWLNSFEPRSVVYASLGTLSRLPISQIAELGLGLESSNRPFIWVIQTSSDDELEKWVSQSGFEERMRGRGLLIRGWAPQVLILSHPAIGGFLTHCGWNSTLEGVSAGLPMVTWPLFAEQFINEKLVVQVLRTGVSLGVEVPVKWGEKDNGGVLVEKGEIRNAIDLLMEGEGRRQRAKEFGEKAKKAMEEGGSSYLNITLLIHDIMAVEDQTHTI